MGLCYVAGMKREHVEIKLDIKPDQRVEDMQVSDLAASMVPEIVSFEEWFRSQGNQPLTGVERSILKTYLGWKLVFE